MTQHDTHVTSSVWPVRLSGTEKQVYCLTSQSHETIEWKRSISGMIVSIRAFVKISAKVWPLIPVTVSADRLARLALRVTEAAHGVEQRRAATAARGAAGGGTGTACRWAGGGGGGAGWMVRPIVAKVILPVMRRSSDVLMARPGLPVPGSS